MKDRINMQAIKVSDLLKLYLDDEVWVDRRYQRKLVWKIEDKQRFIKSLYESIPVPAVIYSERIEYDKHFHYEIIDGLQRTNAIVSFLMGEYSVKIGEEEGFFNPEACNHTFILYRDGKYPQNDKVLSREISYELSDCSIPMIVIPDDDVQIEKIFNRINSTGKKLSPQDIRQATSYNRFSELVRELSSSFRGDYTYSNVINLCDIPQISYGYGLKYEESFWVKNRIFEAYRLRDSKDEEIIAQLVIGALMNKYNAPASYLDLAYDENSNIGRSIISCIDNKGTGNELLEKLCYVGKVLRKIYETGTIDIDETLYTKNEKRMGVLFISLFKAYESGILIEEYIKDVQIIGNFINVLNVEDDSSKNWEPLISAVTKFLLDRGNKYVQKGNPLEKDIILRLEESAYESQMTEYKLGFTKLGCTHPYISNDSSPNYTIDRIAKTLSAMSNSKSQNQSGWIIVGVADSYSQAEEWKSCYGEDYLVYGTHYVVGIQKEIENCFSNSDAYLTFLTDELSKCGIDKELLEYVEKNIRIIRFKSKSLLVIPSADFGKKILYDGKEYYRSGASNKIRTR